MGPSDASGHIYLRLDSEVLSTMSLLDILRSVKSTPTSETLRGVHRTVSVSSGGVDSMACGYMNITASRERS